MHVLVQIAGASGGAGGDGGGLGGAGGDGGDEGGKGGGGGGGTCAPKQMMKPPPTTDESVDHCSCVPADAFPRFAMALNAATPDVVPPHDPPRAHEAQLGWPGQIPGAYPEAEFADGYEILIQSQ